MKALSALGLIALLAGCAQTGTLREDAPGFIQSRGVTPQSALDTIAVGRSTKADVAAALGRATVIPFDSGYEVWVYRWRGAQPTTRSATELVVLFEPSGLARKARVRPGYDDERK
jgi:outer membrane protein assembly factor BamE (lipoprotein component of BamABCDE complex)